MSRLCCAAKLLIQRHPFAHYKQISNRVISTSAPKPNFGIREITTPDEPVHIAATQLLSEQDVKKDTTDSNTNNNSSNKTNNTEINEPKSQTKNNPLPAVTIVDVNGGYGRMDFEERMEHMDRVERIKDGKMPRDIASNLVRPLLREMPTVVDINGYSDDMMYQDKPELEERQKPETKPKRETADANNIDSNMAPNVNEKRKLSLVPSTQQQQEKQEEAKAFENTSSNRKDTVVTENEIVAQSAIKSTAKDIEEICVAPVDIDAFANEEEKKQGTVDIDAYGDDERMQLPPIPKVRNNIFEFKGIKIIMPQRLLRDATYRYRLDAEDKDKPDDIQICRFEK